MKQRLEARLDSIPAPIAAALRQLLRRARIVILLRGTCALLAAFTAVTLMAMGFDALALTFSPAARWIASAMIYAVSAAAAYVFLVVPLARSYTLAGIARMIESNHPEMQERISSAVELLTTDDSPDLRGSRQLIDTLAEAAAEDARRIRPRNEVSMRAVVPFFAAAFLIMAIFAAIFAIFPLKARFLLMRAAMPFANLPNLSALDLEVKPGDAVVARGDPLEISFTAKGRRMHMAQLMRTAGERKTTDEMRRIPSDDKAKPPEYSFTVASVEGDFSYRVKADEALTRSYSVKAVTPPSIENLDIETDYPAYSRLQRRIDNNSKGTVSALAGSTVKLSFRLNKPCPRAVLKIESKTPATIEPEPGRPGDRNAVFKITLEQGLAGVYSMTATDEYGFSNPKFERGIQALPDTPPIAAITDLPAKEIRLKRGDCLPFYFSATDDMGLESIILLLIRDEKPLAPRLIPFAKDISPGNEPVRKFDGSSKIDLDDIDFRGASRISFQIFATDNLPESLKGPQRGYSEIYTVVVDDGAQVFAAQALGSQEEALKNQVAQAKRELEEAKQRMPPVKEAAEKRERKPDQIKERVDSMRERLAASDNTLRSVSEKLGEGYFKEFAEELRKLHEDDVVKAIEAADQIPISEDPDERTALAADTAKKIDDSIKRLDDLQRKADASAMAMRHAIEMEVLADRQEDLAGRKLDFEEKNPDLAKALENPELKKESEQWRSDQNAVADTLARMNREMAPLDAVVEEIRQAEAVKLAQEARELKDEQADLMSKVQKMNQFQQIDKALGDLARSQDSVAELAKADPLTAPASDQMSNASAEIKRERLDNAMQKQDQALDGIARARDAAAKSAGDDPLRKPGTPEERLKNIAEEAKKSAEDATAAAAKATESQNTAAAEADKFEKLAKENAKDISSDKDRAAAAEEQKAVVKALAQKAKEAANAAIQAARESQNQAREAAAAAARHNPKANPEEAGNLINQAEQKARDAEKKSLQAEQAAEDAKLAAALASQLAAKNPGDIKYQADPIQLAGAQEKKAEEAAAAAAKAAEEAAKELKEASENVDRLRKAQQAAERNGQQDPSRKIAELAKAAQKEEGEARQAADAARRSAELAKQAAAQAKQNSDAAEKNQNRRQAAGQALEALRKSLEAEQQAQLAENFMKDAKAADDSIRDNVLAKLDDMQKALKDKTQELLKMKKDALDSYVAAQMQELAKKQDAVAKDARDIAAEAARETPSSDNTPEDAAKAAEKASSDLKDYKLEAAAIDSAQAASALAKLAERLKDEAASKIAGENRPVPGDKEPVSPFSKLAEKAEKAAEEQADLKKEMLRLLNDRPIEHLAEKQKVIAERAVELDRQLEAFQAEARDLNLPPRSQQLLAEGRQNMQNARQNADNAGKTLARMDDESRKTLENPASPINKNLPNEAANSQKNTSAALENAAAKMTAMQAALAEELKRLEAAMKPEDRKKQKAEPHLPLAYDLAKEAAGKQDAISAIQAAESLRAVSREAMEEAEKAGMDVTPDKISAVSPGGKGGNASSRQIPPGFEDLSKRLGINFEDWLKLPGNVRSEILQSASDEGPEEYREIIKRYFEELAKRSTEER